MFSSEGGTKEFALNELTSIYLQFLTWGQVKHNRIKSNYLITKNLHVYILFTVREKAYIFLYLRKNSMSSLVISYPSIEELNKQNDLSFINL